MLCPESKPSLGLDMTYTAMARAKNPATDNDLKMLDRNILISSKGVLARN